MPRPPAVRCGICAAKATNVLAARNEHLCTIPLSQVPPRAQVLFRGLPAAAAWQFGAGASAAVAQWRPSPAAGRSPRDGIPALVRRCAQVGAAKLCSPACSYLLELTTCCLCSSLTAAGIRKKEPSQCCRDIKSSPNRISAGMRPAKARSLLLFRAHGAVLRGEAASFISPPATSCKRGTALGQCGVQDHLQPMRQVRTCVAAGHPVSLPARRGVEVGVECCEAAVALVETCLSQHIAARPTARQLVAALETMQDSADADQRSPPAAAKAA